MGARTLTAEARARLEEMPGWAQEAPEHQALSQVFAKEGERQRAALRLVRAGMVPISANELTLPLWETMLKLTVNPSGKTEEERRNLVVASILAAVPDPSGLTWQDQITKLLGPVWTYEEKEPQTIHAVVPWAPGSTQFLLAERIFRKTIPAAWELELVSSEGFILDRSKVDKETLQV